MQIIVLLLSVVQAMNVLANHLQLMLMELIFFSLIFQVIKMMQQTKLALM
jgi:hypothetical protein